jgi:hypothetical protein
MRKHIVTIALSAVAVVALGFAAGAQQKAPAKAAAPTAITVYKTPT